MAIAVVAEADRIGLRSGSPSVASRIVDGGDPDAVRQAGFRTYGKSKDSRDDLPQVVVGWR